MQEAQSSGARPALVTSHVLYLPLGLGVPLTESGICVNPPRVYFQIQAFSAVVLLFSFKNVPLPLTPVSERKQPHLCVRVLLASSGRGEGSGGVSFYERSSCSPVSGQSLPPLPTVPRHGRRKTSGCAERNAERGAGGEHITTHRSGQGGRHDTVLVQGA